MDVQPPNVDHQEIQIQIESDLPKCFNLYYGPREYYIKWGVPLYRAAMEADWDTLERILQKQPNLATASLSRRKSTVLHLAAGANRSIYFMKQLVSKYMTREDLAMKTEEGSTAIVFVAQSGNNVEVAKLMVQKNETILLVRDNNGNTPLVVAARWGHQRMARYLLSVTDLDRFNRTELFDLLRYSINSKLYGIALEVVRKFPSLSLYKDENGDCALRFLARKKQLKSYSSEANFWTKLICCRFEARQVKTTEDEALELVESLWGKVLHDGTIEEFRYFYATLFDAATVGNVEFIAKIVNTFPTSLWIYDEQGRSIFGLAVMNRHVEVFNLIYETGGWKGSHLLNTDQNGNNVLHMAAMAPPEDSLNTISGAALQMQRELLWYKEVESLISPTARDELNKDGLTPRSLFTKNHTILRKEGEKWMKNTASSCSVVATLVATVTFAAALTVPGGDDQTKGTPIFQRDPIFVAFAIADALSLFSSSIALLMFLGILTSRYAEEDFLKYLPLRLLVGLSTLFLSIASMMVAFALTFFVIFKAGLPLTSISFTVAILAAIPVGIFGFEQYPLLVDIGHSTYKAKYFFRNNHKVFRGKKYRRHHALRSFFRQFLEKDH